MKKWKRINTSDAKKLKQGKVHVFVRGFMSDLSLSKKKRRFVTVK